MSLRALIIMQVGLCFMALSWIDIIAATREGNPGRDLLVRGSIDPKSFFARQAREVKK